MTTRPAGTPRGGPAHFMGATATSLSAAAEVSLSDSIHPRNVKRQGVLVSGALFCIRQPDAGLTLLEQQTGCPIGTLEPRCSGPPLYSCQRCLQHTAAGCCCKNCLQRTETGCCGTTACKRWQPPQLKLAPAYGEGLGLQPTGFRACVSMDG